MDHKASTKLYPIGECPNFCKGDATSDGRVEALVYTKWVGGTCKAYNQLALVQLRVYNKVILVHPGSLSDCTKCYRQSDVVGYKKAKVHKPIAKKILTRDSDPITWEQFAAMVFAEDETTDEVTRYNVLEL